MPPQIDAARAYEKRIAPYQQGRHKRPLGITRYKQIFTGHRNPAEQQLEFDVALWYAFLNIPLPHAGWKQEMIRRIFTLLAFGGLMVDKGRNATTHNWQPWAQDQLPICSAISHTARVLVWLPTGNTFREFWRWLWAEHEPVTRGNATHGVASAPIVELTPRVRKAIKETKKGGACHHFGVNLALGGLGNVHPVSGNIIEDNGQHGHLYLGGSKRRFQGRSALLIATEQSAPADRETDATGRQLYTWKLTQFGRAVQGVPDQYGGKHTLGGHSRFSATGGDDFGYSDKPSALTDAGYGPTRGHYIDGMYIDLTTARFNYIRRLEFLDYHVSLFGSPP